MTTKDLFISKSQCCGCGSCATSCSRDIIEMKADEDGFLYPEIIDESKCINCSRCLKVCPLKEYDKEESTIIETFASSLKDDGQLISCASGGAATGIAKSFIDDGGVVYGAGYSDDFKNVIYLRCNDVVELERLKTSKYSQADKAGLYEKLQEDSRNRQKVLFIGLPCDVAAVKIRFPRWEELYTVELICHGPTSTKVLSEFVEYVEDKFKSPIKYLSTRHKKDGKWVPFYLLATTDVGSYCEKFHDSPYGTAFRYLKRPSCNVCPIKGKYLKADLMIGDYHYVEKGMLGYNQYGVSSLLVHNVKGEKLAAMLDINSNLTKRSCKRGFR